MRFCNGQALYPLLSVRAISGLEDECFVVGEDLEGFWNISAALFSNLHGPDGSHVERLSHRTGLAVGLNHSNV